MNPQSRSKLPGWFGSGHLQAPPSDACLIPTLVTVLTPVEVAIEDMQKKTRELASPLSRTLLMPRCCRWCCRALWGPL